MIFSQSKKIFENPAREKKQVFNKKKNLKKCKTKIMEIFMT